MGVLHMIVSWLAGEGGNPISCAAIGEGVGVVLTFIVSKLTAPLPEEHVEEIFRSEEAKPGQQA